MALVFLEASLRIVPLLQKNTGKTRRGNFVILCLGNSITKGDTLPPGQAYPEQLEKILNLKFPQRKFQVVNAGFSNGNTRVLAEALPSMLQNLHPEIVTFMVGDPNIWNRYGFEDYLRNHQSMEAPSASGLWLDRISKFSRIARWLSLIHRSSSLEGIRDLSLEQTLGYIGDLRPLPNAIGKSSAERIYSHLEKLLTQSPGNKFVLDLLLRTSLELTSIDRAEHWQREMEKSHPEFFSFDAAVIVERALSKPAQFDPSTLSRLEALKSRLWLNFPEQRLYQTFKSNMASFGYTKGGSPRQPSHCKEQRELQTYAPYSASRTLDLILCLNGSGHAREAVDYAFSTINNPYFSMTDPLFFYKRLIQEITDPIELKRLSEGRSQFFRSPDYPKKDLESDLHLVGRWMEHELETLIKMSEAHGAKVLIQAYPPLRDGGTRMADQVLKKTADRIGIPYSDTLSTMRGLFTSFEVKEGFYTNFFGPNDQHLSEKGHSVVADLLLRDLMRNDFLPSETRQDQSL